MIKVLSIGGIGGYNVASRPLYSKNGGMRASDMEALKCGLCFNVLRDPVQLITCGCRYCNSCVQGLMEKESSLSFNCPIEGDTFTGSDIRKDRGCMKEIQQLETDCPSTKSCGWRGKLVAMEAHIAEDCPNAMTTCKRRCGAGFLRSEEGNHKGVCPKREERCEHCSVPVALDEFPDHNASCPAYPMACDFCEMAIPHRRDFAKHLEDVCTECELDCPMAKALSCSFKGKRNEMAQHSMNSHLVNVLEKVSDLSLTVMKLTASNEELRRQNKEKDKKIDKLEKKMVKMENFVYVKEDTVERDGPKSTDACNRGVGTMSVRNAGSSRLVQKSPQYSHQYDSYEPVEQKRLPSMLRESIEKHGNQISRLHESMQGIQQSMTQYSIAVDELRLRQDVQDVKTTHGTFIWKIPDIRRRYRDALDRKTISLYSPPFQTSPHGYRMCVRVYLNGDGSGKGTYISVFFVLMRSEHDDLLNFPFKQSVRFTLINQSNHSESVTEAFAPDLKSQSFQKPEGEMNVASGFPKFARQSVLHDERFTKGNVVYIKAQVDLAGLTTLE